MRYITNNKTMRALVCLLLVLTMLSQNAVLLVGAEESQQSEPVCSCDTADGVHLEGCALYSEELVCTCGTTDGVHGEDCPLYQAEEPVEPIADPVTEPSMSAGIYFDANRQNLDQLLTAEGATLTGWSYTGVDADRYLGITLNNLPGTGDVRYRVVVTMDPVIYNFSTTGPTGNYCDVSFVKNSPLTVNTNAAYQLQPYSGTVTYDLQPGITSNTLSLPIRYDVILWNKQAGSNLGNGIDPLLTVQFLKVEGENTTVLDTVKLQQATSKEGSPAGFIEVMVDGAEDGGTHILMPAT